MRWYGQAALAALSVVLLSLAFAPWGQFWLAWIALTPALIALARTRGIVAASVGGWFAGIIFFALNLTWLASASIAGAIAAWIVLGMSWGVFAAAVRAMPRVMPAMHVLLVAATWCAIEWLRALAVGGFPWLLLGHSQSRWPVMCQIADAFGVYGVSFWVAAVNVLIAMLVVRRRELRALRGPITNAVSIVAIILLITAGYGIWRTRQTDALSAGPRIMLVQCNFHYAHGGKPSASREEIAERHVALTRRAFQQDAESTGAAKPDLIAWSEAMMPPLNAQARAELAHVAAIGPFLIRTHEEIGALARLERTGIITGGYFVGGWKSDGKARVADDRRNSAFFYTSDGEQSPLRYDKIELVPFAETMPFAGAPLWLRSMLMQLAAPSARLPDTRGDPAALTVFELPGTGARFVTPICFENVDAPFIARMLRSPTGAGKRADFIVNLTNDGWFDDREHAQHLQAIAFRAIENRIPIARVSNTGISAFVDSAGRLTASLAPGIEGTLTQSIVLDRRDTLYTRWADAFAITCAIVALSTHCALHWYTRRG